MQSQDVFPFLVLLTRARLEWDCSEGLGVAPTQAVSEL